MPNRTELDDTYEDWEAQARDAMQTIATQGIQPIKVQVDVERPVDGEARAEFVNHLLVKSANRDAEDKPIEPRILPPRSQRFSALGGAH